MSAAGEKAVDVGSRSGYFFSVTDGLPAGISTQHDVEFDGDRVVKTFRAWDGTAVHIVDFESARGYDRAFDVADLVEHISLRWTLSAPSPSGIDADDLLNRFDLRPDERARVRAYRPVFAAFWLLKLLPDAAPHFRNPPGILEDQAKRLLTVR